VLHRFSRFVFDDLTLELTRDERPVRLEPQPARALALLLARPDVLVTRDELRAAIWGGETHVDFDRGLAYCIGQVRTALGDSADAPRFVQTLPRRGFRFIAPVLASNHGAPGPPIEAPGAVAVARPDTSSNGGGEASSRAPLPHGHSRRASRRAVAALFAALVVTGWLAGARVLTPSRTTVAVSIFDNETGLPEYDAQVAGLADLVVSRLTDLAPRQLGIIGNAAPLRQPRNIRNLDQLARSLPADYVVLGQLQREEAGLRAIVHLIRLDDGTHLSARRLIRPDGAIARLAGEIAAEAERAVRVHVLNEPGPR
jgi:DNA-binding winged helix-turn-helix (wHTH) protein/TolB-like protein